MVRAIGAFLDFCYLVRRSVIDEETLDAIDDAVIRFQRDRAIFHDVGIHPAGLSLPRQHSMIHYRHLIEQFGAPNGICSSITESKHIKAVKEPWRRSSRYDALGQMLVTNQRLDKLAASRADFAARGMLKGPCLPSYAQAEQIPDEVHNDDGDNGPIPGPRVLAHVTLAKCNGMGCSFVSPNDADLLHPARGYPRNINALAIKINQPNFVELVRRFLYDQLYPVATLSASEVSIAQCPDFRGRVKIFHSAVANYFAPSDCSGVGGMHHERIRAVPSWRNGAARNDCVFAEKDANLEGFCGLYVLRTLNFFSFHYRGVFYPCALVEWFTTLGDEPCRDTGMWKVKPDLQEDGQRVTSVVHLDCILRGAHLIGVYGDNFLPRYFHFSESLLSFQAYFVNKFADHHANTIAF